MNKKVYILGLSVLWFAQSAMASDQVWRYVDEKTGQVSYSNVAVKGRKGDKLEIMAYPTVSPASGGGSSAGAPIPAEVLRQLQATDPHSAKPPSGLPPLPSLPGAKATVEPTPAAEPSNEPKWAKEVPAPQGPAPSWAQDPFTHK